MLAEPRAGLARRSCGGPRRHCGGLCRSRSYVSRWPGMGAASEPIDTKRSWGTYIGGPLLLSVHCVSRGLGSVIRPAASTKRKSITLSNLNDNAKASCNPEARPFKVWYDTPSHRPPCLPPPGSLQQVFLSSIGLKHVVEGYALRASADKSTTTSTSTMSARSFPGGGRVLGAVAAEKMS